MNIDRTLAKHDKLTNDLTRRFVINYFNLELDEEVDADWISGDVGGIFQFGDYFINFSDIKFCLEKNVEVSKFFAWYDWCLDNHPLYINLDHYCMGAAELRSKQEQSLEKSKKQVEEAKKILKEALEEYDDKARLS